MGVHSVQDLVQRCLQPADATPRHICALGAEVLVHQWKSHCTQLALVQSAISLQAMPPVLHTSCRYNRIGYDTGVVALMDRRRNQPRLLVHPGA